jgi:hypothetical protein
MIDMGQRHQLYYRYYDQKDKDTEVKPYMVSFHNQWLYGSLPLRRLKYVLQYNKSAGDKYKFTEKDSYITGRLGSDPTKILECLITINAQDGVADHVINTTDETLLKSGFHDPRRGDNNDGITVVDFTVGKKPAYAFVNINEGDGEGTKDYLEALSAERYALCYYAKNSKEWKAFGINGLVKYIDRNARLLTTEELAKLFPDMYRDWFKERQYLIKNPKEAPMYVVNAKYQSNKNFASKLLKG